jgi:hypothetical protein
MQSTRIRNLTVFFDEQEKASADQLITACEQSVETITATWHLAAPADCRVYLMTSFPRCVFFGAPLGSQILLVLTFPFWYREFKVRWLYAGGWSQRYGRRQVVGIKPPRLIAETPMAIGEDLFVKLENLDQKFLSIVCHELMHTFTAVLDLPAWFNEGLAMVSVDRCLGKPTVLPTTLELLSRWGKIEEPTERINLEKQSREQIILLYVRGYWLTRYLAENEPDLLIKMLAGQIEPADFKTRVREILKLPAGPFWQHTDPFLVDHYTQEPP